MTRGRVLLVAAAVLVTASAAVTAWPYVPTVDHCTTAVEDYYHAHKREILAGGGKSLPPLRDMRCALLTESQKNDVGRQALAALFPELLRDGFEHAFGPGAGGPRP